MGKFLPRVAFWLIPEKTERARLYNQIKTLAERYSAVTFAPHVTLYSCSRTSQQMELAVAARLAASFQALTLEIDALSGSDKLTETLFVNFQENEEIKDIYSQLHANVHSASSYELHPHLSLLYQKLTAQERDLLIEETAIGLQSIQFNELWAVAIPEQLSSLDDFRGWQTLLTCRLAPRKNVDTIY